jgi:hypothetical protein
MKKFLLSLIIVVFIFNDAVSQTADDIIRFSRTSIAGTSRYVAMGGAFGALGGDASSIHSNPGAIGVYRRSEATFTPQLFIRNVDADYLGQSTTDVKNNFNFSNFAYVGNLMKDYTKSDGWISVNYGVTYNRINNFHDYNSFNGFNLRSSLLEAYVNQANGLPESSLNSFGTALAWDTFLIDTISPLNYFPQIPFGGVNQTRIERATGRMAETGFSFGGNYSNKFFVGASINFTNVYFNRETIYSEQVPTDSVLVVLNDWSQNEKLTIEGRGTNLKLGAIYRANDWLRFGLSFHTPTFFNLNDEYKIRMTANYKDSSRTSLSSESPQNIINYRINTPSRLSGSVGFIFLQRGLFNIDYEFVNYKRGRLSSSIIDYSQENNNMMNNYKAASNIKLGSEFMLTSEIGVRAGYAFLGSPIITNSKNNGSVQNYSVGIGYKTNSFFIDFAYQYAISKYDFFPYDPSLTDAVTYNNVSNALMMTLGFRFD